MRTARIPVQQLKIEMLRRIFLYRASRGELQSHFKIRPNLVSDIISQFLEEDRIVQGQTVSTGGRPVRKFEINNSHSSYAGIMLSDDRISGVVMGYGGRIIYRYEVLNALDIGTEGFIDNLLNVISHVI